MAMTVVVTRDVAPRFRGFLSSCMLEIAPGVYTAPRMSKAVRERVSGVIQEWYTGLAETGSIVMTWQDSSAPGGQSILTWGLPPIELISIGELHLARRQLRDSSIMT